MKKYRFLIKLLYFILLGLFIISLIIYFLPLSIPEEPKGMFNENRLLITYKVGVTGPPAKVIYGNNSFKYLNDKNNDYILLVGNTPDESVYIVEQSDYIVYGQVVGTTDIYKYVDDGIIPVYEVESWKPIKYISIMDTNNIFLFNISKYIFIYSLIFIILNIILFVILIVKWVIKKRQAFT